jgi:hypothetical protein
MMARLGSALPLEEILVGARFLSSLPGFLRHPVSLEEARATLRRRLERREADFLDLLRRAIYQNPESPYRELLSLAGCEYGDLEWLVNQEGVEGALGLLYRQGVYLTVDEFKGRRPVVRGGSTVIVEPTRLLNPRSARHVPALSGGSRGARTAVPIDLGSVRDRAINLRLIFDARGGGGWTYALWGVPGGAYIARMLEYSGFGAAPVRWFSQIEPTAAGLHPRYRWSARAVRWGSLLARVPLPSPEYVPVDDPLPIAHWMTEVRGAGCTPHLHTFVSAAVRLCRAALDNGLDLSGVRFTVTGEPVTADRLAVIHGAGACAETRYGTTECTLIGYGCLAPKAADDVHMCHDLYALIQPECDWENNGLAPRSVLISSLRPTTPFIMLNVSLGDQAVVEQRACGCAMERLGWTTHLHTIRSFEKLTAGGMTFLDTDVIRVLEEALPARFGGGPTDYQLLEEEAEDGRPRLRLLVHPSLGPLDAEVVAEAFLSAIGGGSGAERVMALQWRRAGLLRVDRRTPLATASGKILHLHQEQRSAGGR